MTGYADIEMIGEKGSEEAAFNYAFSHCIIRDTTDINHVDTVNLFKNVTFENANDTSLVYGRKHFAKIDTQNLRYDFRLDSVSTAIGKADPTTSPATDRNGRRRDDQPDIGAFEYEK